MDYTYDRRPHVAAVNLHGLVQKYMSMLGLDVAPSVKVSNVLGAKTLGTCKWTPGQATSTITFQKSVIGDPTTLERVLAHEMAHHAVFLGNIRDLQGIAQERGAQAGPYVREYLQNLRRDDGHNADWLHYAKIINAQMGGGFVSQTSDSTYVQDAETKPYYLLIAKLPNGRYGFQIGVNLSPKMKRVVEVTEERYEGKLIKTTDPKWQHGPRIGDSNWATSGDKQAEMQRLHSAHPAGLEPAF
jgi:hypothetical protein